jgi:hypothetical protein
MALRTETDYRDLLVHDIVKVRVLVVIDLHQILLTVDNSPNRKSSPGSEKITVAE